MTKHILKKPTLRFPQFHGDWKEYELSDIYSFITTNSLSRENLNYTGGDIKNIHYGDIHTKFKSYFKAQNELLPYVNEGALNMKSLKTENFCKEGDLVIADASEDYKDVGKTIEIIDVNNQKILAGLHTYIARPDFRYLEIGFGGYLMQTYSIRLQIMIYATGSKVLGITKGNLGLIKMHLPEEKNEQNFIINIFSTIDSKIDSLEEKKRLLAEYKGGLIQKIFREEIRFKDKEGKDFDDWKETPLIKIFHERKTYSQKGEEYPHISLTTQGVVPKSSRYERDFLVVGSEKEYKITKFNDICYNPANLKFGVIARNKLGDGIFSPIYITFEVIGENNIQFMEYFVTRNEFIQKARKFEQGTVYERMSVSPSDLLNLKVRVPTKPEQEKIANHLNLLDEKIDNLDILLEKTKEFKLGLLQQMFV